MKKNDKLTSGKHKKLAEEFIRIRSHFVVCANMLKRVLEQACKHSRNLGQGEIRGI